MYNDMIFNDSYFDDDNSYDIDATHEDASIFDEDYFDTANESMAGWLLANFTVFAALFAKSLIKAAKKASKSHATIINVDKMIASGMPEQKAISEAKKSVAYLRNNGYTYADANARVVMYNDLTPAGKEFIDGYFEYIGKIDEFTLKKAITANKSKFKSLDRGLDNVSALFNAAVMVFYLAPHPAGIVMLPLTLATCFWAGWDLGSSIKRMMQTASFEDNSKKYVNIESVSSAFGEDYFDDAMEDTAISPEIQYLYNDIDSVNEL